MLVIKISQHIYIFLILCGQDVLKLKKTLYIVPCVNATFRLLRVKTICANKEYSHCLHWRLKLAQYQCMSFFGTLRYCYVKIRISSVGSIQMAEKNFLNLQKGCQIYFFDPFSARNRKQFEAAIVMKSIDFIRDNVDFVSGAHQDALQIYSM